MSSNRLKKNAAGLLGLLCVLLAVLLALAAYRVHAESQEDRGNERNFVTILCAGARGVVQNLEDFSGGTDSFARGEEANAALAGVRHSLASFVDNAAWGYTLEGWKLVARYQFIGTEVRGTNSEMTPLHLQDRFEEIFQKYTEGEDFTSEDWKFLNGLQTAFAGLLADLEDGELSGEVQLKPEALDRAYFSARYGEFVAEASGIWS